MTERPGEAEWGADGGLDTPEWSVADLQWSEEEEEKDKSVGRGPRCHPMEGVVTFKAHGKLKRDYGRRGSQDRTGRGARTQKRAAPAS
mgnify:CR=1 FL=1